jgi:ubiquinone/menaquinone biosynthesis C-methylase UbiE
MTIDQTVHRPSASPATSEHPSSRALLDLIVGYWNTQALHVAAALGIPDQLSDVRRSSGDLAATVDADPASLLRLLRFLVGLGVLDGDDTAGFTTTEMGKLLRRDVPGSMRQLAILYGREFYQAWGELLHAVRTGEQGFARVFGSGMFTYFDQHPETGRSFDMAMAAGRSFFADVVSTVDFSSAGTVVDIAGGNGSLVIELLEANAHLRAVLFEAAHVMPAARKTVADRGLADRCEFVVGDFFSSLPAGGDVYVLSRILHDWHDEQCLTLLRNLHRAMAPGARVVVLERVITDQPSLALGFDVHMLAVTGGIERTLDEYRTLLELTGFTLQTLRPLALDVHALVAVRR